MYVGFYGYGLAEIGKETAVKIARAEQTTACKERRAEAKMLAHVAHENIAQFYVRPYTLHWLC